MNPEKMALRAEAIREIYDAMEDEIFLVIARRLRTSPDLSKDAAFAWQIEKLSGIGSLNQEAIKRIAANAGVAESEIDRIIRDIADGTIKDIDNMLSGVATARPPSYLDELVQTFANRAKDGYSNMVRQSLVTTANGRGEVQRVYERILQETTSRVLSGSTTINKAATRTVIKWGQTGFKSNFVDRGGRRWNATTYAETVLKTTVNNVYNDLRLSRMEDHDVDLVLVNSYPDAREACSKIQGKVASLVHPSFGKYPSIYEFGYGKPDGIRGVNCRHILYPFIPGVNINNQHQYDPEEAQERAKIVQGQRAIERQIRKHKRSLSIAKEMGDQDIINEYGAKIRSRQAAIRSYIDKHDLPRRYDRERMY